MLVYSRKALMGAKVVERALAMFGFAFQRRRTRQTVDGNIRTIVLLEPFMMGDVLSLAVMIDPILERFPGARIVIWCHSKNRFIYNNDPRIWKTLHAAFPWSNRGSKYGSFREWKSVIQSCLQVRTLRPHIAVDTRGDIRSQAVMFVSGSACRLGYKTYAGSNLRLQGLLLTNAEDDPPEPHRYLSNLYLLRSVRRLKTRVLLKSGTAHVEGKRHRPSSCQTGISHSNQISGRTLAQPLCDWRTNPDSSIGTHRCLKSGGSALPGDSFRHWPILSGVTR